MTAADEARWPMTDRDRAIEVIREGLRTRGWAVFDGMNDGERPKGETWPVAILDALCAALASTRFAQLNTLHVIETEDGPFYAYPHEVCVITEDEYEREASLAALAKIGGS